MTLDLKSGTFVFEEGDSVGSWEEPFIECLKDITGHVLEALETWTVSLQCYSVHRAGG